MPPKFNVEIPGLTIIIGLQGYGKSHLIRYLMYQNRKKFSYGLVFCNTLFSGDSFDYVPNKRVYPEYVEEKLDALMKIQVKNRETHAAYVIFDDAIYGNQWKSLPFKRLMTQLRHYNIWCCISTQDVVGIPPVLRSNTFNCFIFPLSTRRDFNHLYEYYGQFFDNIDQFKKYILEHAVNHHFISYNPRVASTKIEDKYQVMCVKSAIPKFEVK